MTLQLSKHGKISAKCGLLLMLSALLVIFLLGCKKQTSPILDAEDMEPVELVMAQKTPVPTAQSAPTFILPTDEPNMLFDENGNITLSKAYKAQFTARAYPFEHVPRVLVYHTHARESFCLPEQPLKMGKPSPTPVPENSLKTRSTDNAKNVVHLGDLLTSELKKRGFTVFHDTTDVEQPKLSTAYERSRTVMAAYKEIDLYIDLHRNAADINKARDDVVMLKGERVARMFFVVGTGIDADGWDANAMPNWKDNYRFAMSLSEQLRKVDEQLVKEPRVKQGRYNQDMGLCILAEVGHNANLLTDAEHTIPYLADAIGAVCQFPKIKK